MDPVTHFALGASLSQLCLYKWDKNNAWLVGGLAALAPDLDVFIRSSQDPLLTLYYHRQFSHALFFIPFGALIVSLALMLFKRFRASLGLTYLAAFIGYATHGLLDAFTSYGTVLYWPFSEQRVSWDVVSIIDYWVTLPLLLGLLWTIKLKTIKGLVLSVVFVSFFFVANAIQHARALDGLADYAKKNQLSFTQMRAFPQLASSLAWQGIATTPKSFYAFTIATPLTGPTTVNKVNQLPLLDLARLPDYLKNSPSLMKDLAIFTWFSDNYTFVIKEVPLTLGDGRFLWDENASKALWRFQFVPNEPYAKRFNE